MLRLKSGLTIPELAKIFAVSNAAVSRWLSGERQAPADFLIYLQARAGLADVPNVIAAQKAYRRQRRQSPPRPVIRLALPPGVDEKAARRLCAQALAAAHAEARR